MIFAVLCSMLLEDKPKVSAKFGQNNWKLYQSNRVQNRTSFKLLEPERQRTFALFSTAQWNITIFLLK